MWAYAFGIHGGLGECNSGLPYRSIVAIIEGTFPNNECATDSQAQAFDNAVCFLYVQSATIPTWQDNRYRYVCCISP